MNYPDSVRFLYSLGNEVKTAKYGIERITVLLAALGSPERLPRIVHVAGTNGKGSTCAMIESGLRAAGLRTGLFTSPHLVEPTERIRIDGCPVSAVQFTAAFDRVHRCAEELLDRGTIDFHPTYFETVTASLAMLGDLNIGEPGALIGFAGPRVIEQTIRQKLPEGFQRSEFLLKHGMLDAIVPRPELKSYISKALTFFCGPVK